MRTVFIFRHAKSDWSADEISDHQRDLAARGRKDAKRMGKFLAEIDQIPAALISSSARRALETVRLAARAGKWKRPLRVSDALYACSAADILAEIRSQSDSVDSLLIACHEPACSEAVSLFTGGARVRFPTAGIARLDIPVDVWADCAFGQAELVWLVPPSIVRRLI